MITTIAVKITTYEVENEEPEKIQA